MIAFENVFPPIPSEVILSFGGFMTTTTTLTIPGVIIAATAGSLVGAIILFYIGRLLGVERMERLVDRWGKIIRVTKKDIRKADAWFDKYGYWTVLFCRMVPLVRSLISIPAGMSGMKFGVFMIYTTIGTLVWNLILVLIGAALGESWGSLATFIDVYSNIVYALIAVGVVILGYLFYRKRSRKVNNAG